MTIINCKKSTNPRKGIEIILRNFAKQAYDIDPSRPISFYYQLFLDRYEKKYISPNDKKQFFKDDAIET